MGDLSTDFSREEFIDRRTGQLVGPTPELLWRLQLLRNRIGRALPIVSGYRSPSTNRLVGGARRSRHLVGDAVDIPPGLVTVDQAIADGFSGIGHCEGWVVHLDCRPVAKPVIFEDC